MSILIQVTKLNTMGSDFLIGKCWESSISHWLAETSFHGIHADFDSLLWYTNTE